MTGWAATNTLRNAIEDGLLVFVDTQWEAAYRDAPAALALVEAALDAAANTETVLDELIGWINTDITGCLEVEKRGEDARLALAAALRAVREGAA